MRPWLAVLLLATVSGCGHNIGDSCTVNIDCSIAGDRFCDVSSPGGYCTIDGCDVDTCPTEAVCIRFLTPIADQPCDLTAMPPDNGCSVDEICVCDNSVKGVCQNNNSAHCAPESTERRWCQLRCSGSGQGSCRVGYECREPGTGGAESVPRPLADGGVENDPVKFCAPNP